MAEEEGNHLRAVTMTIRLLPEKAENSKLQVGEPRSHAPQKEPVESHISDESSTQPQVTPLRPLPPQLGERPTLVNSRRLTIHDASSSRPSLLTKQISFKSSSAVPTLSTLAATSTASKSKRPENSTRTRRASSGSGLTHLKGANMAARDVSATDLLKQAISHR